MVSLRALDIIAKSDIQLFKHSLAEAGLTVVGRLSNDPLEHGFQTEAVLGIASHLTDGIHDSIVPTKLQESMIRIAQNNGYIVALSEGLDQLPGTLPNPIVAMLRGDEEEEEEQPAGGPDQPPPPGGDGGPEPPSGTEPPPM